MGYDFQIVDADGSREPGALHDADERHFRLSTPVAEGVFFPAMEEIGMGPRRWAAGSTAAGRVPAEIVRDALDAYEGSPQADKIVASHIDRVVANPTQSDPMTALMASIRADGGSGIQLLIEREGERGTVAWLMYKWHCWIGFLYLAAEHGGMRAN